MGTQENKASGRRFVEEVINRGKFGVIDELTGPNFVDHSAPPGVPADREGSKARRNRDREVAGRTWPRRIEGPGYRTLKADAEHQAVIE